jgi:cold shock CspA family protein
LERVLLKEGSAECCSPSGAQWIHEIKYDGYRIQLHIDGDGHDIVCHAPALPPGMRALEVGQHVGFEIGLNERARETMATNVRLV